MDGVPGPYAFPTVPGALYDLERDVGESTDVSQQHPEVVARLDRVAEVRERTRSARRRHAFLGWFAGGILLGYGVILAIVFLLTRVESEG